MVRLCNSHLAVGMAPRHTGDGMLEHLQAQHAGAIACKGVFYMNKLLNLQVIPPGRTEHPKRILPYSLWELFIHVCRDCLHTQRGGCALSTTRPGSRHGNHIHSLFFLNAQKELSWERRHLGQSVLVAYKCVRCSAHSMHRSALTVVRSSFAKVFQSAVCPCVQHTQFIGINSSMAAVGSELPARVSNSHN
eukprot:1151750-Pelagomonas_calceolata.AAC.16